MVRALKQQGLVWGGDWDSIKDPPHFQLAHIPLTPSLSDRACFARGGCAAVWARYPAAVALEASAHEHLSLPMLLWAFAGGAAQSAGRWLMEHFGHPLLTRFRSAWENTAPAAAKPTGDSMNHEQNETNTVTDLQAGGFVDFFKGIGKLFGKLFTPDQEKKISDGITTFVTTDVGKLALDAVEYVKVALPNAGSVELRDAAKAKLKADAATAGKDLSTMGGAFLNWAVETALQYALSKGLQAVATVALAASAEEPTT